MPREYCIRKNHKKIWLFSMNLGHRLQTKDWIDLYIVVKRRDHFSSYCPPPLGDNPPTSSQKNSPTPRGNLSLLNFNFTSQYRKFSPGIAGKMVLMPELSNIINLLWIFVQKNAGQSSGKYNFPLYIHYKRYCNGISVIQMLEALRPSHYDTSKSTESRRSI